MLLHEKFIGHNFRNEIIEWQGSDTFSNYRLQVEKQPDDWYYKNVQIKYSYNEFGHRCNNLDKIDLDNYVLFTGCSHTEGVGLELEKTYAYLTSKQLGVDYYNMGIGGSGLDVLKFNLITWLSTTPKLPRAIVIQWPDLARFSLFGTDQNSSVDRLRWHLLPQGSWAKDNNVRNFLVNGSTIQYFVKEKMFLIQLLSNICKIPIYTFNLGQNNVPRESFHGVFIKTDSARDMLHAGVESNQRFAKLVLKAMNK